MDVSKQVLAGSLRQICPNTLGPTLMERSHIDTDESESPSQRPSQQGQHPTECCQELVRLTRESCNEWRIMRHGATVKDSVGDDGVIGVAINDEGKGSSGERGERARSGEMSDESPYIPPECGRQETIRVDRRWQTGRRGGRTQ